MNSQGLQRDFEGRGMGKVLEGLLALFDPPGSISDVLAVILSIICFLWETGQISQLNNQRKIKMFEIWLSYCGSSSETRQEAKGRPT